MKVKIDNFWLAGDPADPRKSQVCNFRIDGERVIQVARYTRAEASRMFDRKNRLTTVTFDVARIHADLDDAEKYILEHGEELPGQGLVTFISTSSKGQETLRFMKASCVQSYSCSYIGKSTRHSYQIIGGMMLKVQP